MDLKLAWEVSLLALTIWREARGEPRAAKVALACSVMNRVRRPCWWGTDVVSVIEKRWQFSSLTDPRDPQLVRWPPYDGTFRECLEVASLALAGLLANPVPGADSYHDTSIAPPSWTAKARGCGQVGRLVFYDVDHDYEREVVANAG